MIKKKKETGLSLKRVAISLNNDNDDLIYRGKTFDDIKVEKRNGNIDDFDEDKIKKAMLFMTDNDTILADILFEKTKVKLKGTIKSSYIHDQSIKTCESLVSRIQPQWEYIGARGYLIKIRKESYGSFEYPSIFEWMKRSYRAKTIGRDVFDTFHDEELQELDDYIDPERDYIYTYKALTLFTKKYCAKTPAGKLIELPQLTYMRVAMYLFHKEDESVRIDKIKRLYDVLSDHDATLATPIMLNAGSLNTQLASCVLNKTNDDARSILETNRDLGIYSKFSGGTSWDISDLRAKGSIVEGNKGESSGPMGFVKIVNETMHGFNQGGKRPGSCAAYFQWWHMDFDDLIVMKSILTMEEDAARNLKYALKLNNLFIRRWIEDDYITLFDPKDTNGLTTAYGKDFDKLYEELENKSGIRKRKVKAREIWQKFMKQRTETGNIYVFHEENVNFANMTNRYISQSNLCTEILEPTRASKLSEMKLMYTDEGEPKIIYEYDAGEIALCNLASYNLEIFHKYKGDDKKINDVIEIVMDAMDNTFELQFYPLLEGKYSNMQNRFVGLGVSNLTKYLALENITIDTQESLEKQAEIFERLSFKIYDYSSDVAKDKGSFSRFKETKWAKGITPFHLAKQKAKDLVEWKFNEDAWNNLGVKIKSQGVRHNLHMAIAPTATSGNSINVTPSVDPIFEFEFIETNTEGDTIALAPDVRKLGKYYKPAKYCDQGMLIRGAAIRQIFLDQSQSMSLYFIPPFSLKEQTLLHFYAFSLGVKTLYYFTPEKQEECVSCGT